MVFKNIISFGLLTFLLVKNEPIFCLVQRRESIPYILFMMDKLFVINPENIHQELQKMTNQEKDNLLQNTDPNIVKNVERNCRFRFAVDVPRYKLLHSLSIDPFLCLN